MDAPELAAQIEPWLDAAGPDLSQDQTQNDLANLLWEVLAYLREEEKPMQSFAIPQPGDILLFHRHDWLDEAILLGEDLEDGSHRHEYVHVGVAVDANRYITALSRVGIYSIADSGPCDVYRPPISPRRVAYALQRVERYVDQPYGWWQILDDGLRYLSHGRIHLPDAWMQSEARRAQVCSQVTAKYLRYTYWKPPNEAPLRRWSSPEDCYLAVRGHYAGSLR